MAEQYPTRFADKTDLPEAGLVVMRTNTFSTRQGDHKYQCHQTCCDSEAELSHITIKRRILGGITRCRRCADQANRISQKGIPVSERKSTRPSRRKRPVEAVVPAWPVPASVLGKRRAW